MLADINEAPDVLFLEIDYEKEVYQVIQYVKERRADTQAKFVAMVLQEEKVPIERTLKETTVYYLVKPFQIQDALALVSASR